jgi:ABC-2 type transport system ATP-binding protein
MTGAGIVISDLVVARGGRRVLDGLSLVVAPSEVYTVLGSNGAGKSTMLSVILGLLNPVSGDVVVAGRALSGDPDAVRAAAAYLPESVALYDHLSAQENVIYFLALAGVRRDLDEIAEAFRAVRLNEDAWTRRVGSFSKGMRQKTAIALALLRRTPALLLDEPTTGLDPAAVQDFHMCLSDLRHRGVCVLMVSHDLLGCIDTADRIGVLSGGRIAQEWQAASAGPRYDLAVLHSVFSGTTAA